jgi:uncharacterized protein with GYD domain
MPTFITLVSWTDQGIRTVKDAPKRLEAGRVLAKKLGVEVKQIYVTSGETDLVVILETANPDNIPKFVLAMAAQGNGRTRTMRAWSEVEFAKMVSELP